MASSWPWGLLLLVVAGGALLPLQASLNGRLASVTHSAPLAAGVSFAVGALALALLIAAGPFGRPRLAGLRQAPPWAFAGGLTGAFFIATGTWLLPVLGATRTMGLVVGGQLVMGLVIDHFGWLGAARRPVTARRWGVAALILAAMAALCWGRTFDAIAWTCAFAAGCGIAVGFSINAEMSRHTGHPLGGALSNFVVGTVVLTAVVRLGVFGPAHPAGLAMAPAWAYLGGVFGAAYVAIGLVAIPRVGLAVSGLATVFGQLAMSMILDVTGLFGPVQGLSPQKLAGAVLLLAAVIVLRGDQLRREPA